VRVKIEEIKKQRSNNLKLDVKFFDIEGLEDIADTFVSVTFTKPFFLTVHTKSSKLYINSNIDYIKASMFLTLKKESDIEKFLNEIGFEYNWLDFASFAYIPINADFEAEFTVMDTKEIDYKTKLLSKIHGLFTVCAGYIESKPELVKSAVKNYFKIESLSELDVQQLEKVYHYSLALTLEAEYDCYKQDDKDDVQIKY